MIALIDKYFPDLTRPQRGQFEALYALYADWNTKINVISRKDFDQLYLRHVLHSLSIAKVCPFAPGARVLDVGCGGGFPSVPLAILFPEAHFTAVDSIGKKIKVVQGVAEGLGLANLTPLCARAETLPERYDYVVSRAVTEMPTFVGWVWDKIDRGAKGRPAQRHPLPQGRRPRGRVEPYRYEVDGVPDPRILRRSVLRNQKGGVRRQINGDSPDDRSDCLAMQEL